jgi:uncharacterized protein (AIM24 family)
MFITGNVAMDAEAAVDSVKSGIKRALAGESAFHVTYKAGPGGGVVGLTGPYPGSIREHELDGEIICERHAYLCHHGEIEIDPILAVKRGMGVMGGGELSRVDRRESANHASGHLHGSERQLHFGERTRPGV